MTETAKILLKNVPLFAGISDGIFNYMGNAIIERKFHDAEILFSEGDTGTGFFIIKSGSVEILKGDSATGRQVCLATRGPGDFFGEMSLLENSPRFATAKSVGESEVLELSRENFKNLITEDPTIALEVMGVLSSRLRQADLQMIHDLQEKNEQLEKSNKRLLQTTDELEKSNQSLQSTNKFLEKIISASKFFMIVTDKQNRIFVFNEAARNVFGLGFHQVAGKGIEAVLKPAGHDELLNEIETTMTEGNTWSGDILTTTGDDKKLYVELVGAKVFDEKGEVFAALYMGRDVSEEKNIERQMILLERMATRGEMAAEIAHELNNYLSIVLGNLELLQMELEVGKTDKAPKKISSMKSGLDKITRFTDGLMMYSRPSTNKEEFDLCAFLESELYFIKTQNRFDNVDFEMDLDENLPLITADKSQIQQALLNFLNNAADATAVNTGRRLITIITSYIKESESISISVKDNGVGLDEDSIDSVFKQHFTTKDQGHGFGLLAVKRVIKCHAGKVMAENNPDGGAKFSIIFPIKQDENTINLI